MSPKLRGSEVAQGFLALGMGLGMKTSIIVKS